MKKLLTIILLLSAYSAFSQDPTSAYFALTRKAFNKSNAYETTAFVEQRWRLPGNKGFNESIYHVEEILKKAGFVLQKDNEQEAPLTYRLEKRPMKQNTWEPIDASLTIEGQEKPFLTFKTNRNMIAISSTATPAGGQTAEVVYLDASALKKVIRS